MSSPPSRLFRTLRRLDRSRAAPLRAGAGALGGLAATALSGHAGLGRAAGGLFRRGDFATGLHLLRWSAHHGWAGMGRTPFYDASAEMDAEAAANLLDWLANRPGRAAALARLNALARLMILAPDAATQEAHARRFAAEAQGQLPHLPIPDPKAKGEKGAEFTQDDAEAALTALARALTAPWYVISGTFLGAVREGTFLAHDYDIDIGIDAADFDEAALRAALSAAPDLVFVNQSRHLDLAPDAKGLWTGTPLPALYRVLHVSGIGIDIFVHHRDGGQSWHGSMLHRWDNSVFDLADYTLSDIPVRGPADADRYLSENYGTDWRIPKRDFDCSTGTPNVLFPRNPAAVAHWLRVATSPGAPRDREVARLILWQEGYLTGDPAAPRFAFPWRDPDPGEVW